MTARREIVDNPASEFFAVAVERFLRSADPAGLYRAGDRQTAVTRFEAHLRDSLLYLAFSTEAYINAYLAVADPDELNVPNRTVDKYAAVVSAETRGWRFDRGAGSLQRLAQLMSRRNRIVHPRPEVIEVDTDRFGDVITRYDPVEIGESIVALARIIDALNENLEALDLVHPHMEAHDLGDEIDIGGMEEELLEWFTGDLAADVLDEERAIMALGRSLRAQLPAQDQSWTPPAGLVRLVQHT